MSEKLLDDDECDDGAGGRGGGRSGEGRALSNEAMDLLRLKLLNKLSFLDKDEVDLVGEATLVLLALVLELPLPALVPNP